MMAMGDPCIKVVFGVSGEFDPDQLTELLCLDPTEIRRLGEDTPTGRAKVRKTSWCIEQVRYGDSSIEDAVCAMLEQIWRRRAEIVQFSTNWPVSIDLVVTVRFYEDRPLYSLSPPTMRRISDLGATFGLDIYDLSEP
jgi:hypothetical protein